MKDLDSNIALQLGVVGFPDFSHATASQTLAQFIFSKVLPVAVCICTHSSPHTPEKSWVYLHSFPGNRITSKKDTHLYHSYQSTQSPSQHSPDSIVCST